MKRVVTFVFASLLVVGLSACGAGKEDKITKESSSTESTSRSEESSESSTQESTEESVEEIARIDYEIKDGDPLTLLKEAGYSLALNTSHGSVNPIITLENLEEKIVIDFHISDDSGQIWEVQYENRKEAINESVYEWGVPNGDASAINSYINAVRKTGISTQTLWDLILDSSIEKIPGSYLKKTQANSVLESKVGKVLSENEFTFYSRYTVYDSEAYELKINVSNMETGVSFAVLMYKGEFRSLNYTSLAEEIKDQEVFRAGKHTSDDDILDSYLATLKEMGITKEEFMEFFTTYENEYYKLAEITPGQKKEAESAEGTPTTSSNASTTATGSKQELEDLITKYDALIAAIDGFSSNPSTYTLAAYTTFMADYTELLTMFEGLDNSLASSSDSEVLAAYTKVIEKNTALSLAMTKLPSGFAD